MKGAHPAPRTWMSVGVQRNGTKGVFVSVLDPIIQGTENFLPSTFPSPRVVVRWIFSSGMCRMPFYFIFSSCPMAS